MRALKEVFLFGCLMFGVLSLAILLVWGAAWTDATFQKSATAGMKQAYQETRALSGQDVAAFDVVTEQLRISDCAASTFWDMRVQGQVKSPGYASILFNDEVFDQARRGGEKAWKMCFKQSVAYLSLSSSPAQLDALRKLSEKI